jgi:hypothetical protein
VDLPQIEVIGFQPPQGLVEHFHGQARAAAVRANLGHEENFVSSTLERPAQPILRPAIPVFPAVIAKCDPGIDGLVDEPDGILDSFEITEVMTADAERGDLDSGAAEGPSWNFPHFGSFFVCHDRLLSHFSLFQLNLVRTEKLKSLKGRLTEA